MKATVILAHPNKESFNYEIYQRVLRKLESEGIILFAHDLYEEDFNPILTKKDFEKTQDDVIPYINHLLVSDMIIFIHPNWWGQPPAILKGWIDRVFKEGEIYTVTKGKTEGKLNNKKALVINTSNISNDMDKELFGEPILKFWKHIVFASCGLEKMNRINFDQIAMSSAEQRKQWLDSIDEHLNKLIATE